MAVIGEELFVTDKADHSIHVYATGNGAYHRTIRGDFRGPKSLVHHEGRLYLVENEDEGDEDAEVIEILGRRIFVLSPSGETLQVYNLPDQGQVITSLMVWGRKLLVRHHDGTYIRWSLSALEGI